NFVVFFFSSRRRHTRCLSDWSSDVCSSDLNGSQLTGIQSGARPIECRVLVLPEARDNECRNERGHEQRPPGLVTHSRSRLRTWCRINAGEHAVRGVARRAATSPRAVVQRPPTMRRPTFNTDISRVLADQCVHARTAWLPHAAQVPVSSRIKTRRAISRARFTPL